MLANNTYRVDFLYDNLMISSNIIHAAYQYKVKKLLFLGSSCIYPKLAPQPLKEEYLLTGELEATNEPYAIAKIAGIKLCEAYRDQFGCNFISAMPTNLYGPNDIMIFRVHMFFRHLSEILSRKKNNRANVEIWGTGEASANFCTLTTLQKHVFI